jgi:hypothetical protein
LQGILRLLAVAGLLALEAPAPGETVEDCFAASCEAVAELFVADPCGLPGGFAIKPATTAISSVPVTGAILIQAI